MDGGADVRAAQYIARSQQLPPDSELTDLEIYVNTFKKEVYKEFLDALGSQSPEVPQKYITFLKAVYNCAIALDSSTICELAILNKLQLKNNKLHTIVENFLNGLQKHKVDIIQYKSILKQKLWRAPFANN
jgi:hypothetical protein